MTNIDIREFTTLSGTDGEDSVLLVQESGANGKIKIALFKQLLTSHVIPSIVEGTWWIGDAPTGVTAIGKTPLLRRGKLGVEYKYDTDDNTMWRLLINYDDIVLRYQDLTEMQRHELSGKNAYLEGYSIGGKTATSQTLPRSAGKYISSFIGFAPADDPQILGMVIIHDPQGIYYGGTIAAPVLRDIYDNVLPYLGIEKK